MKSRRLVTRRRLWVEELEGRVVPSTLSTSTNWSGYAVATRAGAVTSVAGSWKVPTAVGTATGYAATWVGIDGWSSPTVEQIGTEVDVSGGQPVYYAWYEMYPSGSVNITSVTIRPGDTISAQVSYSNSKYTLQLTNTSRPGESFAITQTAPNLQRSSAEWIVEAPSNGYSILPLADFGAESIAGARATINGTTGPIDNSSWANEVQQINMTSQRGATQDTTSALTDSGGASGFTATFTPATSTPPPPTTHHRGGGGSGWQWWWWFSQRQTGTMPTDQAALASSLSADTYRLPATSSNSPATQPATLPAPSVVVSNGPSFFVPPGPGVVGSAANVSASDVGDAQQPAMRPVLPDGNEPGQPAAPRCTPDAAPMPPAAPDEARASEPTRGAVSDRACDACFTDGRWAPTAPTDGAQALIDRPAETATAVESIAGVLFTLSLGGYWRLTTAEAERRRRPGCAEVDRAAGRGRER